MNQSRSGNTIISIFFLTVLLFPILPQYIYVVGGINVVNFLTVFFIIVYISGGKLYKWNISNIMVFYFIYAIVYAIMYYFDAGILKAGTNTITCIIIPYLTVGLLNSRLRFYKAIDTMITGGGILALIGLAEAILKYNFIQPLASNIDVKFFHEIRYGLLRIMTTFGQPIAYGIYQFFVVTLILYRLNTDNISPRKRRYLKRCYILCVLNVFLSVSRIPILAFIIMQILVSYRKSKGKFLNYAIIVLVVVFFGVIISDCLGLKIPLISDLLETIDIILTGQKSSSSTVGVGNRLDLWYWVYESMGNSWIFGKGVSANFAYQVYEWQTKSSIENQYLNILYHNGLVGLTTLLLSYGATLIYTRKGDKKYDRAFGEKQISFNTIIFILLVIYYVCELGVQESDITRIYVLLISLLIAYNRIAQREIQYQIGGDIR